MTLQSARLSSEDRVPFELKGSLFTLTVLYLRRVDLEAIERHLAEKISQAPGFFTNAPVIVDLSPLPKTTVSVDFAALYDRLRRHGMIPVGVRNGSIELQAAAIRAGLPVLPEGRPQTVTTKTEAVESEPPPVYNKIVTQPVRSGQQIYVPDGDLILMGTVSAGAEVLADGNIHVYGRLRGRALAGAKGNDEARIFCQSLEAELVSIAGRYRVIEELDESVRDRPVQMYLSENRLIIKPLSQ